MRLTLRRGLFFSLLLALTLPLASCDLFGSDDSSPDWVGTWEEVNGDIYLSLSEEEIRLAASVPDSDACVTDTESITEVDGNVVTIGDDGEGDSARLEVSGENLTIDDPDGGEEEYTRVDSDPSDIDALRDLAGCE